MIVLLKLGYRAIGMVVLITIFNVVTQLLNFLYCKYRIKIKIVFGKFKWGFLREVATYSFYIFLGAIIDRLYWSTGQLVIGAFVGTAAVAVFAVGIQLEQMYMAFSTAISGVFLPKVTAMVTQAKSEKSISDLFIKTGRIQFIIMAFILTGFILFGKQFIVLWAGADYTDVYIIALLFFVPLTIPLIQNLGITILQARNDIRFRALFYIVIAIFSLGLQLILVRKYGGIGCAIAISIALVIGHVFGMNIYYYKKQNIDIPKFWKEIGKMSVVPAIMGSISFFILRNFQLNSFFTLGTAIAIFSAIYIPLFWIIGMNQIERDIMVVPVNKILIKLKIKKANPILKK
jgi:O-antigen/teichoic acid export membrane protein